MTQEPIDPLQRPTPPVQRGGGSGNSLPVGGPRPTRRISGKGEVPPFSGLLGGSSPAKGAEALKEEFSLPRTFGKYVLLRVLGKGGMGVVFLAEDRDLKRKVALKILRQETLLFQAEARERFRREARAAARLDHPGICPVYDVGEEEGFPYMAMRLVRGRTLAEVIRESLEKGALPDKRGVMDLVHMGEKVARTLHAAHEAGLVHRDIKPANIMIDPGGNPILLDFGLARETAPQAKELTLSFALVGTPHYLPPERLDGRKGPPDRRSDIYSLGAALYEALTLRCPFDAEDLEELKKKIRYGIYPDPRHFNPAVPKDLALVLGKAMEKNPERRYGTALEFAEDLRRVRTYEPVQVRPAGPLLKSVRWAQRNPVLAASLAGIFLALLVGLLASFLALQRIKAANKRTTAMALLTASKEALPRNARLSLLLALESYRVIPSGPALSQVIQALLEHHEAHRIPIPYLTVRRGKWRNPSPGGRYLVLPAGEGTCAVYDRQGRKVLGFSGKDRAFLGGRGIGTASFSPDGSSILLAGTKGLLVRSLGGRTLLRWRAEERGGPGSPGEIQDAWFTVTGKKILLFEKETSRKGGTAYFLLLLDREGKLLGRTRIPYEGGGYGFSRGNGKFWIRKRKPDRLLMWDEDGKASGPAVFLPAGARSFRFSPSGRFLGCKQGLDSFWFLDLQKGERRRVRGKWRSTASGFAFSPAGDLAALILEHGEIALFPLGKGTEAGLVRWFAHPGGVRLVAFSPGGKLLLTASTRGEASIWTTRGERVCRLAGHEDQVYAGGFLGPDFCYTCSSDGTTRIWNLRPEWAPHFPVSCPSESVLAFHGHSDAYYLVAKEDEILENLVDGTTIRTIPIPGKRPLLIFGNPRGEEFLLSSGDDRPRIWLGPEAGWKEFGKLRGRFIRAAFSPTRKEFVSFVYLYKKGAQPVRNLVGFSFEDGRVRPLFTNPSQPCRPFLYSADGNSFLAGIFPAGGIALFGRKGNLLFRSLEGTSSRGFRFLRDGKILAATVKNGVFLLDRNGKELKHFPGFSSHLTAFDADLGRGQFVCASRRGDLVLRNMDGRILFSWKDPDGPIQKVAFTREPGRILCVTSKAVKVLDARRGAVHLYLRPGKVVWRAGLTPSKKWLWMLYRKISSRRWIQFLPLEEKTVLSLAEKAAGKGFTSRERKAYGAILEGAALYAPGNPGTAGAGR